MVIVNMLTSILTKLLGYGTGGSYIQRIHAVEQGNFYGIIGQADGLIGQSGAFGAEQNCQPIGLFQTGIGYGHRIVSQRHGCSFEAKSREKTHREPQEDTVQAL